MIEAKVADALALDYPRERLELIVASDGSSDRTVELARAAGADLVLDLPRGGKMATQNAAVERAGGEIVAFSDANASWEPGALAALVAAFDDPEVGYAVRAGPLHSTPRATTRRAPTGATRCAVRELESGLGGITAGNGGIYAVRRSRLPVPRAVAQPRPLVPVRAAQGGLALGRRPRGARRARRWSRRSRASSPASGG